MDQINEYNNISETDDRREIIKQKLRQYYDGRIVRKDLTKSIREGANVPVYVLEYLLGQYCNSDDQEIIDEGVDNVKRILRDNYVRPDEAQKILSLLRERGSYTVTNGKLVSKAKGIFSYIFDLETELHISDDAPIDISTGLFQASGTVLMCEDFQIIVQLKSNIGERIGNALIRVEPWKLLEALQEKLRVGISLGKNKMASRIMKDGPKLATKEPGKQIPKGHDAVIEKAMSEPVCVVWGPPGTGKTHTMAELAINSMNAGKTVLIVSHSNVSVDGVAKKIDELLRKNNQTAALKAGKILRYGYVRDEELNKNPYVNSFYYTVTKNPALNEKLDKLQAEYDKLKHTKGLDNPRVIEIREDIGKIRSAIREQEQHYVSEASVVATSNAVFPLVMIDEKITWYGVPDASWKFRDGADEYHTVCPIVCRLDGKHTAELIRSLSDLEYRETDKGKKQLSPRPETPTDDPNGAGGLSEYVSQNIKCPDCKKPLRMTKGKSGKTILWCKECKKTHLLAPDDINHYMLVKHVKCPIHKCDMTAKVGKYGLYIKCDAGHNMKPEEI